MMEKLRVKNKHSPSSLLEPAQKKKPTVVEELFQSIQPLRSDSTDAFKAWYRHSGQEEIDEIPLLPLLDKVENYGDLLRDLGGHYITHLYIEMGDTMIPLDVVCPHVKYLKISKKRSHRLECLSQLKDLEILNVSSNNFSSGFPEVICKLTSLKQLHLVDCQLTSLPQSLSSLTKLQTLYLSHNNFRSGLPFVLCNLLSLRELDLRKCQLTDLPFRLNSIQNLEVLDLSLNNFKELPSVIYQLPNLEKLDLWHNRQLHTISVDFLKLHKLAFLDCTGCRALKYPPQAVCEQGLAAIKQYLHDVSDVDNTQVIVVPVAVIGNIMAGKTSLVRSLKSGERTLTVRDATSPLDETTQVFQMDNLQFTDTLVRFIDFGGHDVYHIAYQLAIKEQCIPLIVVNLEEYDKLSSERGYREATRRLCFDWMSHLYLACPRLGSPVLVLTHRDKLSDDQFELVKENFLKSAETIRAELLREEKEFSEGDSEFCRIFHLSDVCKPLFFPEDIFALGKHSDTTDIQCLRKCLERRCDDFKMTIPRIWKSVSLYIDSETSHPYILLSDIKTRFSGDDQLEVILRYLHNTGKVLWFENKPTLSNFIFHQIPKITNMIAVLFHHAGNQRWNERVANVTAFRHGNRFIEKGLFKLLVEQFKVSGVLDEVILMHLLKTETEFPPETAVDLLMSFNIIHGPVKLENGNSYIIPYFSTKYMGRKWISDGDMQLRLDIVFNGLQIPKYVYQLMTVAVLNFKFDPTNTLMVANDGVTILHGRSATHLIHSYNNSKVTLQISTPVEMIGSSWQRLIELTQFIVNMTIKVWKATRPLVVFYCSHCLIQKLQTPATQIEPSWFRCTRLDKSDDYLPSITTFAGIEPVACANDKSSVPTVPKPLRFPCYQLTDEELSKLKVYVSSLKPLYRRLSSVTESLGQCTLEGSDNEDSDISDAEEKNFYSSFTPWIILKCKPTTKERIKRLYANTDKVYQMTNPVRGRALIITVEVENERCRRGADMDSKMTKRLFQRLRFKASEVTVASSDLEDEIQKESQLSAHKSYGMFVLVLLGQLENLAEIKQLLSASSFPAMRGKPKFLIAHAYSAVGHEEDVSQCGAVPKMCPVIEEPTTPLGNEDVEGDETDQSLTLPALPTPLSNNALIDADDFFVIEASSSSWLPTHGSSFIRTLVTTFYKHSCHRDVETLFKIVQHRVRELSISFADTQERGTTITANIPVSQCTFTNFRKLFLFPKFPVGQRGSENRVSLLRAPMLRAPSSANSKDGGYLSA